jgi:hypothetical protein
MNQLSERVNPRLPAALRSGTEARAAGTKLHPVRGPDRDHQRGQGSTQP